MSTAMTVTSALVACGALGLQHGFDWDHLAAVSDIAMIQPNRAAAILGGMLYSVGHATTVAALGLSVIVLHHSVPGWISERLQLAVGISLVALGGYIAIASARSVVPCGRAVVLSAAMTKVFKTSGSSAGSGMRAGAESSLALGVLHGLGAETPTQLAVLLIAANLGRPWVGVVGLGVFATSMFISNAALSAVAIGVAATSGKWARLMRGFRLITAAYSVGIGASLALKALR